MARWRYATSEEYEALPESPEFPLDVRGFPNIFQVLDGEVQAKDGKSFSIPEGKWVTLLQADWGESWVYRVLRLRVLINQKEVEIKPQSFVAVFSLPPTEITSTDLSSSSEKSETRDSIQ